MRSRGIAAMLTRDERAVAALAVIVQRARHQLLAGPGLARDHHGEVGLHQARQHAVDFLHRRRAADQRDRLASRRRRPASATRSFGSASARPTMAISSFRSKGFGRYSIRAALGGADRRHEGVLRAHDDDRQIRPHLLDPRQQVEGVLVRHHDVGDDEIALALADPAPQRRGIAGQPDFVAGAGQRLVQNRADGGVVIGDENATCGHC